MLKKISDEDLLRMVLQIHLLARSGKMRFWYYKVFKNIKLKYILSKHELILLRECGGDLNVTNLIGLKSLNSLGNLKLYHQQLFDELLRRNVKEKGEKLSAALKKIKPGDFWNDSLFFDSVEDVFLDDIIGAGIPTKLVKRNILGIVFDRKSRNALYKGEQCLYQGTRYLSLIHFISDLKEISEKYNKKFERLKIVDIGSGYGRVLVFLGLTFSGQVVGIEIVNERVKHSQSVIKGLNMDDKVTVCGGSILDPQFDENISDGDVFFFFNPLSKKTMNIFVKKLRELSLRKQIFIFSFGPSSLLYFNHVKWLELIKSRHMLHRFYISKHVT